MNYYVPTVIGCLFCVAILTRALPFLFTSKLAGNTKMQAVGKRLSAYIMMLLVIYQVNLASFESYPFALPAMLSLLVVISAHVLFHRPLLSMILGTVSFVLLKQLFV